MNDRQVRGSNSTLLWIVIGAALFLLALVVSAVMVPELRPIHFLQAFIYVAIVILARHNSAWGYGAGFSIGIAWNALGLFVTRLILVGAVAFWSSLRHGHVEQLVPMMVTLGGVGHFALIIACLYALVSHTADPRKWWKSLGGGVMAVAYFAMIAAIAQPH